MPRHRRQLLLAAVVMHVCACLASATDGTCDPDGPKLDCGAVGTDRAACEARGCCWQELTPGSAEPWCWAVNGGDSQYRVVEDGDGPRAGVGGRLRRPSPLQRLLLPGDRAAFLLEQTVAALPMLGPDAVALTATVDASCSDVFRLTLVPAAAPPGRLNVTASPPPPPPLPPFTVPPSLFTSALDPSPCPSDGPPRYAVTVKHDPFSVHVAATRDPGDAGAALLDTTGTRLVVKPRYSEWTTSLHPESTLYGFGERTGGLVVDRSSAASAPRTVWARDRPASYPGENLYGAWPVWMEILPSGSARGGLIISGTALDVVVRPTSLSFRSVGPVVDVAIFTGTTPAAVLDQLTRFVGRPALPPAWSLGIHQSRWGYDRISDLEAVIDGYAAADLPLDVLWSDIDHMHGRRDFTLSPQRYPPDQVRAFLARLADRAQKWVPILDPGIKAEAGYAPYDKGLAAGVFLLAAGTGKGTPFIGRVWPGLVAWPDFVGGGDAVRAYWSSAVAAFHALAPFDGLWIDMNEPSNFNEGGGGRSGGGRGGGRRGGGGAPSSSLLPYLPNNGGARLPLLAHTLPPDVRSSDGTALHLDSHNLYGHAEAAATVGALRALRPGERPFILTRSSFPGTGAYAAHWTGDNAATWEDLTYSIWGVLASGLVGMPMAGADVCGFSGNTTAELCARWVGVAALQPFFRDHSDHAPQELFLFADLVRAALRTRTAILPILYTALAAAAATGAPAARPLWFEFPGEAEARVDRSAWLVGRHLMAAPCVEQGATKVEAWLPPGTAWVDLRPLFEEEEEEEDGTGGAGVAHSGVGERAAGAADPSLRLLPPSAVLTTPLGRAPPVLLRCGGVVPLALSPSKPLAAAALTDRPVLTLVACLGEDGTANGELWSDDGVTDVEDASSSAAWFDVTADEAGLNVTVRGGRELEPGLAHWPRVRAKLVGGSQVVEGVVVEEGRGEVRVVWGR